MTDSSSLLKGYTLPENIQTIDQLLEAQKRASAPSSRLQPTVPVEQNPTPTPQVAPQQQPVQPQTTFGKSVPPLPEQYLTMPEAPKPAPTPMPSFGEVAKISAGYSFPRAGINFAMMPSDIANIAYEAQKKSDVKNVQGLKPEQIKTDPLTGRITPKYSFDYEPAFGNTVAGLGKAMPTSADVKKSVDPYLLAHPQTPEQLQMADVGETGLTYALPYGEFKMLPFMARFGLGSTAETVATDLEDKFPFAKYLPVAAMIGGEGAAGIYKGLKNSEKIFLDKINAAYQADIKNGIINPSKVDPNKPILELAVPGSSLRKLITAESRNVSEIPQRLVDFNTRARMSPAEKISAHSGETGNIVEEITGTRPNQSSALESRVRYADQEEVGKIYDLSRKYKPAQSIDPAIFGDSANLPIVKDAEKVVQENIANMASPKKRANYVIPDPKNGINGNLAYWDAVYRQLRDDGRFLGKTENTRVKAQNSKENANVIRDALDGATTTFSGDSLYANSRSAAQNRFGSLDAIDTGNKFYKNETSNALEFQKDLDAMAKLTGEQKDLARYGFLDSLHQDISRNGSTSIAKQLENETSPLYRKAEVALGKPELDQFGKPTGKIDYSDFDLLRGKIMRNSVEQNLKPIDVTPAQEKSGFFSKHPNQGAGLVAFAAAGATHGLDALQNFLFAKGMLDSRSLMALASATAAALGTKLSLSARNSAMQKAAGEIVEKLSSGKASDLKDLSRLTRENPFANAFYKQIVAAMRSEQLPEGQANGGRVGRASGGRIDVLRGARALMRAAENAKKNISKTTETILDQPDEIVAHALKMANGQG